MTEKKSRKKDLNIPPFESFFAFNLLFLMPACIFLISIHAPQYEVRHTTVFYIKIEFVISIHAPIVGCDFRIIPRTAIINGFNPRTHRGVRHGKDPHIKELLKISIHAPIVGCDPIPYSRRKTTDISIHAPIVGCDLTRILYVLFQSTHPSWGATLRS